METMTILVIADSSYFQGVISQIFMLLMVIMDL